MRLNGAAWLTTFDDLQVQVLNPASNFIVTNVAGAESTGVELEGEFAVTEQLRFTGALQYVDATYDDDVGGLTTPICGRHRSALCFGCDRQPGLQLRRTRW